jgi:hypothetical protein
LIKGRALPGQAARVLASLRAAYAEDLLLRKFAHLNPRLSCPQNVSHLINAARRPALDQVAHLWIADRRVESTGKVRPHDGERTPPQSDRLKGQPRCDLEVVKRACDDLVAAAQCFLALPPTACVQRAVERRQQAISDLEFRESGANHFTYGAY